MFTAIRRNPGLAALFGVGLVIATYLAGLGLVWKTYVDAGELPASASAVEQCRIVCGPAAPRADTKS